MIKTIVFDQILSVTSLQAVSMILEMRVFDTHMCNICLLHCSCIFLFLVDLFTPEMIQNEHYFYWLTKLYYPILTVVNLLPQTNLSRCWLSCLDSFGFLASKDLKLFGLPIFWFWAYLGSSCVLCAQYCKCLWIVHSWLPPSSFSNVYLCLCFVLPGMKFRSNRFPVFMKKK